MLRKMLLKRRFDRAVADLEAYHRQPYSRWNPTVEITLFVKAQALGVEWANA